MTADDWRALLSLSIWEDWELDPVEVERRAALAREAARRRQEGMLPGAFERQSTVSMCIPCERQCPARSDYVKSQKLRVGGCREVGSERRSAERCEVRGRR